MVQTAAICLLGRSALHMAEENSNADVVFWARSRTGKSLKEDEMGQRLLVTTEDAIKTATSLGIDFGELGCDLEQFRRGMEVELEHGLRSPDTNVTDDGLIQTGKIALAHLREFPDYYDRLAVMEVD